MIYLLHKFVKKKMKDIIATEVAEIKKIILMMQ
jgi:hypothetical protein